MNATISRNSLDRVIKKRKKTMKKSIDCTHSWVAYRIQSVISIEVNELGCKRTNSLVKLKKKKERKKEGKREKKKKKKMKLKWRSGKMVGVMRCHL